MLGQAESLFALSNGHIGVRGTLDEGDPSELPGTYLNSFYETRPLPYAEAGYGYPESGQTIVNVTDGKLIRLMVDDEPFDLRYGEIASHERVLDLRTGLLKRTVEWTSPSGRPIRIHTTRMVSLTQRAIVAIHYEVEALETTRVVIQSELVANEEVPPLVRRSQGGRRYSADRWKPRTTAVSIYARGWSITPGPAGCGWRPAMDHLVQAPDGRSTELTVEPDWARVTVGAKLQPGERISLTKFVAYGWSSRRTLPALRDQVDAALTAAMRTGWDEMVREQREVLDEFWRGADVEVDGDPSIQQAIRFALFHVLPGRPARRAAADRSQGPDRTRI